MVMVFPYILYLLQNIIHVFKFQNDFFFILSKETWVSRLSYHGTYVFMYSERPFSLSSFCSLFIGWIRCLSLVVYSSTSLSWFFCIRGKYLLLISLIRIYTNEYTKIRYRLSKGYFVQVFQFDKIILKTKNYNFS